MAGRDGKLTGMGKTACVTGASGYVGSHMVKQLLQKGYTVRATVRDATNENKYGWIKDLATGTAGTLELHSADLLQKGSYDIVMDGCDYVCHVAAAVTFVAKRPEDIIDPAVEGTRHVFDSILKSRVAKRVVVTSSIGAIIDYFEPRDKVFTEADWHQEMNRRRNPYGMGKTLAEKYAWQVYQDQKFRAANGQDGGWSFELVCLHPATILGELLHKSQAGTSAQVVLQMLDGTLPMAPDIRWPVVHIRDVALAHVRALEDPAAAGRYILAEDSKATPFIEVARFLREEYPKCKAPSRVMPTCLLYIVALFNPAITTDTVTRHAGRPYLFSNARAAQGLGIDFLSPKQAVLDTARSLQELKLVPALN